MLYRITLTPRLFEHSHTSGNSRLNRTLERNLGYTYFRDFPVEWAGYILLTDTCQISAQWLYETDYLDELEEHLKEFPFPEYKIGVYEIDDEEQEEALIIEK